MKNEKDVLIKKIISNASSFKLISQTVSNLRIGEQLKRIVKKYQPKAIITTFEGHPYERIVYRMSREALNNIYCIGYIHTGLSQYQHSVRRELSNLYDPDEIMTPGKTSYNQIINSNNFLNTKFSILGSHRKIILTHRSQSIPKSNQYNTFLVLPEGMLTECKILLDFIIQCSIEFKKSKFIFRLHPYNRDLLLNSFDGLLLKIIIIKKYYFFKK